MNKHGLSRDIPNSIKRNVRQRDGFGCVICGSALIQYDHFDPPFNDAKMHDSNGIILLCPTHHAKKTNGTLSLQTIQSAIRTPKAKQQGYSNEVFDIGAGFPIVFFGGGRYYHVQVPLEINNVPVLKIDGPEEENGPFRISGDFFDRSGNKSLTIVQNEWQAQTSNWDVEAKGNRIVFEKTVAIFTSCWNLKHLKQSSSIDFILGSEFILLTQTNRVC